MFKGNLNVWFRKIQDTNTVWEKNTISFKDKCKNAAKSACSNSKKDHDFDSKILVKEKETSTQEVHKSTGRKYTTPILGSIYKINKNN
jgi:hypothetical protein